MSKKIAVLSGDGIGPEVVEQAQKVMKTIAEVYGHTFEFKHGLVGAAAIDETGDPFPKESEELCKSADAILFGAIGDPKYDNDPSAKVRPEQGLLGMRKALGLYANVRPVRSFKTLEAASPLKSSIIEGTDFVVYRELTGGIYFGEPRGRSEKGDVAFDTCVYSKHEIIRITQRAFEAARKRNKKVTLVDKANVLATSRLWRETVKHFAEKNYPDVQLETMFVDNAAMKIILNPKHFDVILTENLFGDILTDEASVITGSLGMLPSASLGETVSLYEPIHGSYPEVAGQNLANPMAAILSVAMLLETSFGLSKESAAIQFAVEQALEEGHVTQDINPKDFLGTQEVGDKIAELIQNNSTISV